MNKAINNLSISYIMRLEKFQQAYARAIEEGYDSDDERHPSNWCQPCIEYK